MSGQIYQSQFGIRKVVRIARNSRYTDTEEGGEAFPISEQPGFDRANGKSEANPWRGIRQDPADVGGNTLDLAIEIHQDNPGREAGRMIVGSDLL
jgi:hypothetical protein